MCYLGTCSGEVLTLDYLRYVVAGDLKLQRFSPAAEKSSPQRNTPACFPDLASTFAMDSRPQHFGADTPDNDNVHRGKRKADGGAPIQTRAKRNRYISIAWYASIGSIVPVHIADIAKIQQ